MFCCFNHLYWPAGTGQLCLIIPSVFSHHLLPKPPFLFFVFLCFLYFSLFFSSLSLSFSPSLSFLFLFHHILSYFRPVGTSISGSLGPSSVSAPPVAPIGLSMPATSLISSVPLFSLSWPTGSSTASHIPVGSSTPLCTSDVSSLLAALSPSSASTHVSKAAPLILSPALPPIPGKIVEKIQKGENPDLKKLLSDNIALAKKLAESHQVFPGPLQSVSKFQEISDPMSWIYCFLSFIAVKLDNKEARGLIAYAQIILDLVRRHGGSGWIVYDNHFRSQLFAGGSFKWNEVNPSLLASSVLANPRVGEGVKVCTRCMTADHSATGCALASLEVPKSQPSPSPNPPPRANLTRWTVNPYPPMGRASFEEPCRHFNRGSCSSKTCQYEHTCSACFKGAHQAIECKLKESRTRLLVPGEDPVKGKSATP